MTVRFDDAIPAACVVVRRHRDRVAGRHVLLRDLYGYVALLVDRSVGPDLADLRSELHAALGAFSPGKGQVLLGQGDMASLDEVLNDADAMPADGDEPVVSLVERQLVGGDWLRGPDLKLAAPPRLAFHGVKGGVGRSTALAMAAWHLARQGRRVLAVDLDLESPGVSTQLVPSDRLPRFGVVDWLVESAVGQGDDSVLDDMLVTSPLATDSPGQIFVAPAGGRDPGTYAAKLGRAYLGITSPDGAMMPFAERLDHLLGRLTSFREVDVVLIDSRAGLHEISAAVITHLGAQTLLFAGGGEQTFWDYQALFRELRRAPRRARAVREAIKVVAALIPGQQREAHLQGLLERSYDLFLDNLYDEVPQGEISGFSYDLDDPAAPHYPLSVFWAAEFTGGFSPVGIRMADLSAQIEAAFGSLFRGVDELLREDE